MDQNQTNQPVNIKRPKSSGFGAWHIIFGLGFFAFGMLGFVSGVAYNANQQAQENEAALRAAVDEKQQLEQQLKEIALKDDLSQPDQDAKQDVAEKKTEETIKPTTPSPVKPEAKPPSYKPKDHHQKNHVKVTQTQPVVTASNVAFTIRLPKAYGTDGYCKVLVKHQNTGARAIERQVPLNGTNRCSITLPRSDLKPASHKDWQAYVSFEDYSTKTYGSWADQKIFRL